MVVLCAHPMNAAFPASRAFLLACALSCCGASCDRVAEPDASPPPGSRTSDTRPDSTTDSTAEAPDETPPTSGSDCPVPLAEPPPPTQSPAANCPEAPAPPPVMPRAQVTFSEAPGSPRIDVELALTSAHRAHGLMYRRELPSGEGMLFSWPVEAPRSFWMRNTCLPLDMLFIAGDGTILGILEQVPPMNDEPRSLPCPARHVLEVPAGWSREHHVAPGQRIEIAGD